MCGHFVCGRNQYDRSARQQNLYDKYNYFLDFKNILPLLMYFTLVSNTLVRQNVEPIHINDSIPFKYQ